MREHIVGRSLRSRLWTGICPWTHVLAAGLAMSQAVPAMADEAANYPARPVRLIVPVSAGGSTDTITRIVAQKLGERWHQPVVVDNVTGAGGTIGASHAAKATPDGYTLLVHGDAILLNASTMRKLPYRMDDFVGVNRIAVNPQVLVSNPKFEPKTLRQYIDYAKKSPNAILVGTPTNGGIGHLTHVLLDREAGISVTYIAYKGGAPAAVDTLAGHVNATLITLAAVAEYIKQGKLVALAVSTPYRSPQFPNVPTMAESGYPKVVVESWQGMLAPKETPKAIVDKLNQDLQAVMRDPEVIRRAEAQGFRVATMKSPAEFGNWLKDEFKKYDSLVKSAKITVN